jgi:hypothetical protein
MGNEQEVGVGTTPDGKAVKYFKNQDGLVIVRDGAGSKVTHSDTAEGLRGAGYKVELYPEPKAPESPELADLRDELAEAKERIADLEKENAELKKQAAEVNDDRKEAAAA